MKSRKQSLETLIRTALIAILLSAGLAAAQQTIEFWDVNTRAPHVEAFDKIMADFEAETGVKVIKTILSTSELMTQVSAAAAAGTLPDVILADYGDTQSVSMGLMGVAAPMTYLVDKLGIDAWIHPIFLDRASFDGELWGVPWITFPHVLVYRKDLFDEKGLEAPTTWDELYEDARALTEDTNGDGQLDRWGLIFGFREGFPFMDLVASNADYWWDADGNPTIDERTAETLDYFRLLANDTMYPGSVSFSHEDTRMAFTQGVGAMIITSTSYLFPFDRDVPEWFDEGRIAATGIPVSQPGREGTWIGYNSLVVTNGPKQDLARQFVEFVIRPDNATEYFSHNIAGHLPALSSVWEEDSFWQARDRYRSTYESALESVRNSHWDEPVVPWSGMFFARAGRDKVMENIYVHGWSTERVMEWLGETIEAVRNEWAD